MEVTSTNARLDAHDGLRHYSVSLRTFSYVWDLLMYQSRSSDD